MSNEEIMFFSIALGFVLISFAGALWANHRDKKNALNRKFKPR